AEAAGMSLVRYEIDGPAAVLTLDRADRRNALSRALIADLDAAVARADDDPAARAIILTGAGSVFCAGMDLRSCRSRWRPAPERRRCGTTRCDWAGCTSGSTRRRSRASRR
ncbi:MAG: enoyl-CoA hydratase-related protein, partial [Gemmataceae bacterium]